MRDELLPCAMAHKFNKNDKRVSATESCNFCEFHGVFQRQAGATTELLWATLISRLVNTPGPGRQWGR